MANRTIRTDKNRAAFLAALSETGNVTDAVKVAGISRPSAYEWRADDPAFAADWERSYELGTSALEDEAIRRARDGWLEPVFHLGKPVGAVRKYSDTLLIFMLKARRPEKYRERYDARITVDDISRLSDAELRERLAQLGGTAPPSGDGIAPARLPPKPDGVVH